MYTCLIVLSASQRRLSSFAFTEKWTKIKIKKYIKLDVYIQYSFDYPGRWTPRLGRINDCLDNGVLRNEHALYFFNEVNFAKKNSNSKAHTDSEFASGTNF